MHSTLISCRFYAVNLGYFYLSRAAAAETSDRKTDSTAPRAMHLHSTDNTFAVSASPICQLRDQLGDSRQMFCRQLAAITEMLLLQVCELQYHRQPTYSGLVHGVNPVCRVSSYVLKIYSLCHRYNKNETLFHLAQQANG